MLRLSFWVWLVSSPLVWYHFHIVAPIAIPLNLAISIPLGLALLSGLVTGVFGWLPWLGAISGGVCGQSLELISWLVAFGKQVAGGHIWLPAPPLWWIVLFYAGIGVWLIVFKFRARGWLASGLVLWLILGIASFAIGPRGFAGDWFPGSRRIQCEPYLAATFLDVGHGTSVVIELPDGRVWLYDAGHLGAAANSHRSIAAALWEMRVARVDRLILSHADSDHYNAVRGLLERFRIGRITSTRNFWRSEDVAVQRLVDELRNRRIHCETWASGDTDVAAGATWQVLHPTADFRGESDNANSLCLLLSFGGKRILLPGDLDGSGLLDLMKLPARPCHVLMAPHHGSLTRDPTELLRWCQPELVVISGNHRAVRPAVIERFQPWTQRLAVTFRDGAVRYRVFANHDSQSHHWSVRNWSAMD
jgi:competence protein ComEC